MPKSKPIERTRDEVVTLLESIIDGTIVSVDLEDFLTTPIVDPELDAHRSWVGRLPEWYPPEEPGAYCGKIGAMRLHHLAERLIHPRRFLYNLVGHGWVEGYLSDGEANTYLIPSAVVHHPIEDLADQVILLLNRPLHEDPLQVTCDWDDEPGEWRWLLTRSGTDLEVKILYFANGDFFKRPPEEQGELQFSATFPLLWFASQVRVQLRELQQLYTPEEYKAYARHEFPLAAYERLNAMLRTKRRGRTGRV